MISELRPLRAADLEEVARVHLAAFPSSAISRLGPEAARRYYEWQLVGPYDCHAIGVFREGRLIGFCFGGRFRGALGGFLRTNRLFLMGRLLVKPWLLRDPIFLGRLKLGLAVLRRWARKPAVRPGSASASVRPAFFGILSIAVDPAWQGEGVGQLLMRAAEAEAHRRGYDRMRLSVNTDNEQAVRFYQRGGGKKRLRERCGRDTW